VSNDSVTNMKTFVPDPKVYLQSLEATFP